VFVDHVQGDAYAAPSSVRCRIPIGRVKFPDEFPHPWKDPVQNRAAADYLQRVLNSLLRGSPDGDWTQSNVKKAGWGSSKGGDIQIDEPGQCVLQRFLIKYFVKTIDLKLCCADRLWINKIILEKS